MAMAVLLTLGALFLFISQQSDIGVGNYTAADAFLYTFLNLPQQAFETAADRRHDRRVDGPRKSRGGKRTGGDAGIGRFGVAYCVARGSRGPHALACSCTASANMSHRRSRNSPSARKPPASSRTSVSPVRAARGSRTAISSCGCRRAKSIRPSAACRCSNSTAEPSAVHQRAERISVADPGALAHAECRDHALRRGSHRQ